MTSVEIEDVLTSIRRLVTQDLRPKPPVAADKLLLTPALRVVAHADEAPAADEAPFVDADLARPEFVHRAAPSDDLAGAVTSIGAEVPDDGYEAEFGDIGPADALPVPEWPESSWIAPDVISAVDEAEVVALTDSAAGWAQADDAVDGPRHIDAPGDAAPVDSAGDAAEAAALAALADVDEDAGHDAAEAGAEDGVEPGLTELDEDMLRNIVRDIIREELHGSLGERITRNVRKLVRAEINRAMAARDLE